MFLIGCAPPEPNLTRKIDIIIDQMPMPPPQKISRIIFLFTEFLSRFGHNFVLDSIPDYLLFSLNNDRANNTEYLTCFFSRILEGTKLLRKTAFLQVVGNT